jgi:hypothetical protein
MAKEKDVDLFDELKKELNKAEDEETPGASPEKPQEKVVPPQDDNAELTEADIEKLTPRAQKRIREQAEKIKDLEAAKEEKPPEAPEEPKPLPKDFKTVTEFLAAVEDEPSRNLLEKFYGVIKNETSTILAPIEKANANAKFDEEFGKYEKLEGLADYKNDLRKTFLRNPNQSLKALIGETVADLQLSRIKPLETTPSTPKRGEVDTSNLTKDELYDMLETGRE